MRFSVVVRRLPPPFYTTVKTKSNLTEFGLEKFRSNTELEFETIGIISKFIKAEKMQVSDPSSGISNEMINRGRRTSCKERDSSICPGS